LLRAPDDNSLLFSASAKLSLPAQVQKLSFDPMTQLVLVTIFLSSIPST
jgi:hypothetical protein